MSKIGLHIIFPNFIYKILIDILLLLLLSLYKIKIFCLVAKYNLSSFMFIEHYKNLYYLCSFICSNLKYNISY